MRDGPTMPGRPNALLRLWHYWDDRLASTKIVEPRRALIPDYELYEPPPSGLRKVLRELNPQFVAFVVMLCLAMLLAVTGLIAVIARSTSLDVPWLIDAAVVLGAGIVVSLLAALPEDFRQGGKLEG